MPALVPTDYFGSITWLGVVPNRANSLRSETQETVFASFSGAKGEVHGGLTRPSCSRVLAQYKRETAIRNVRQFTIVSAEELAHIAEKIGVDAFDPAWIGASMVISGIPDFTHIPPSSRLQFKTGATLTVDMENHPCTLPGPVIEQDAPGHGRKFKTAAKRRRGVTAWVECEGELSVGDEVRLHIPAQRIWNAASGL
jgi:hypothetical protein